MKRKAQDIERTPKSGLLDIDGAMLMVNFLQIFQFPRPDLERGASICAATWK